MKITDYCADLTYDFFNEEPWGSVPDLVENIRGIIATLGDSYVTKDDVAIHRSAIVENSATIKGPAIIGAGCFVGPHSLLRAGVILGDDSKIGPGCEVKCSIVGKRTALAHFNFVGDSIIGSDVNLEAGAVLANHFNEREDKTIYAVIDGEKVVIGLTKFGALVGDRTKIGANAVSSPGTILSPGSVVKRLELVEQC